MSEEKRSDNDCEENEKHLSIFTEMIIVKSVLSQLNNDK